MICTVRVILDPEGRLIQEQEIEDLLEAITDLSDQTQQTEDDLMEGRIDIIEATTRLAETNEFLAITQKEIDECKYHSKFYCVMLPEEVVEHLQQNPDMYIDWRNS